MSTFTVPTTTNTATTDLLITVDNTFEISSIELISGTGRVYARGIIPGYFIIEGRQQVISCGYFNLASYADGVPHTVTLLRHDPATFNRLIGEIRVSDHNFYMGDNVFYRKQPNSTLEIYLKTDLSLSYNEILNAAGVTRFYYPAGMSVVWFDKDACMRWTLPDPRTGFPSRVRLVVFYADNLGMCVPAEYGICPASGPSFCATVGDPSYNFIHKCTELVTNQCLGGCPPGQICGQRNGIQVCMADTGRVCAPDEDLSSDGACIPAIQPCTRTCSGSCFNAGVCPAGTICAKTLYDQTSYSCTAEPYFPAEPPPVEPIQVSRYAGIIAAVSLFVGMICLVIYLGFMGK